MSIHDDATTLRIGSGDYRVEVEQDGSIWLGAGRDRPRFRITFATIEDVVEFGGASVEAARWWLHEQRDREAGAFRFEQEPDWFASLAVPRVPTRIVLPAEEVTP